MSRRWRPLVAVLVGVVAFCACGGSGLGSKSINDGASRWLQAEVASARSSAANGDSAAALAELQRVVTDAQTFRDRNMIGPDRASQIQLDAQRVISAINGTATTTVPTTTAPQPSAPARHHKHGQGDQGD